MRAPPAKSAAMPLMIAGGAVIVASAVAARLLNGPSGRDDAPGYTARRLMRKFGRYQVSGRSVTINRPRAELFAWCRDPDNVRALAAHMQAFRMPSDDLAAWTLQGVGGKPVRIEAGPARVEDGKVIAWRSTDASEMDAEGRLEFHDAPGDRGTFVTAIVSYTPRANAVRQLFDKAADADVQALVRHDLKRLKMLIETGEIATGARNTKEQEHSQP